MIWQKSAFSDSLLVIQQDENNKNKILNAQKINSNTVDIEATHSKNVTGKQVEIRANCLIETVYYSESISIDENSTVKNKIKI